MLGITRLFGFGVTILKICFITDFYPPAYIGGPGEVVYNLQKYFLETGDEAYIFTCGASDPRYPNTIRTPFGKRLFSLLSPFYYLTKIQNKKFDILNIHTESGMGIAPFLFFRSTPKIVTTLHTEYLNESKATKVIDFESLQVAKPSLEEWLVKYFFVPLKMVGTYMDIQVSDHIVAVSEKTKADYLHAYEVHASNISVINNGVDSKKFNPEISGDIVRKKYSICSSPVLLYVGSGAVSKGVLFAFLAFKKILLDFPDANLIVVGIEYKYNDSMLSLVKRLGILGNVVLIGRIPNYQMPYYYAACDVVVLPSLSENLPVVILEAMSSGKPIVASKVGGIPEIIKDRANGLLVEPADVNQLAKALLSLLGDSSMMQTMGYAGRQLVEKEYDWSKIGQKYRSEFERLL